MLIASGGFGLCGIPELLIAAIRDSGHQGPDRRVEQRGR
jgi:3-oxoacid CoA-transferase subunit A